MTDIELQVINKLKWMDEYKDWDSIGQLMVEIQKSNLSINKKVELVQQLARKKEKLQGKDFNVKELMRGKRRKKK